MKKLVIVPDSFKGTLSSVQVCEIVSAVIKKNYPDTEVKSIPVADGGEGTAEALLHSLGGRKVFLKVRSPLGRELEAYYIEADGKTAVIETALASGITLEKENNALLASSFGTGQLIKKALDEGAKRLVIGIGGSAMTDAGTGCLAALGARFYDSNGDEVYPCGKNLQSIEKIDLSDLDRRIYNCEVTALCDVKNPLYGKNGAAYIFAPQKGATERDVEILDKGLESFSYRCAELLGEDFSSFEGAGAAGGLGFALKAFLKAEMKSGIDTVLNLCAFEREAESADLIITGEGKLDSQSLMGKVPFGVASRCKGKRVVALVGVSEVTDEELMLSGISEVIETNPEHLPFEKIRHCAKAMLYEAAEKIKL